MSEVAANLFEGLRWTGGMVLVARLRKKALEASEVAFLGVGQ